MTVSQGPRAAYHPPSRRGLHMVNPGLQRRLPRRPCQGILPSRSASRFRPTTRIRDRIQRPCHPARRRRRTCVTPSLPNYLKAVKKHPSPRRKLLCLYRSLNQYLTLEAVCHFYLSMSSAHLRHIPKQNLPQQMDLKRVYLRSLLNSRLCQTPSPFF